MRRTLHSFDTIAILIGITIGSGIFRTPKEIATYHASFDTILLFWVLAGVFVYIGGLIYAELGSRLPHTGGEYVYLNRCFGPYVGFMFGWSQLFIIRTSAAAGLSIVSADYINFFLNIDKNFEFAIALAVLVSLGIINYVGVRQASFYNKFSTIVKVGGLVSMVAIGLFVLDIKDGLLAEESPATAGLGPIGNAAAAMMLIVFSYIGWDRVGYVAGEMVDPKQDIPRSMLWGIVIVMFIYLSANILYHFALGMEGVRNSTVVAADTANLLFGPVGGSIVALLVIISATGSINATMMTSSRVYYAMAKDGLFFSWFRFIHPFYQTPSHAILAHCLWAAVILMIRGRFENIVAGMTFAILIFYSLTTIALFKLRNDCVGEEGCYRMPFYPILPAIYLMGIISLLGIRAYYEWQASLKDLAFILSGLPFALIWCHRYTKSHPPTHN